MVTPVSISNGLGWSLDNRLMYYIDTPTCRVDVFDYDIDTGDIANRRMFVDVPPDWGTPDGLAIDTDGYVWVAMHGGGTVRRFTPDGQLRTTVTVPVKGVTSCAFGGEGLRDLYITTSADLEPAGPNGAAPDVRLAGGLYRAATGATGLATVPFAG
jgi:sugar lactone lactonase YvrE